MNSNHWREFKHIESTIYARDNKNPALTLSYGESNGHR